MRAGGADRRRADHALDVTIQAQILQLIKDIQAETGMGLIMITHDLGVIAETVDRVVVMYGGKVMETGPVEAIFAAPLHPYTRALLNSIPGQVGRQAAADRNRRHLAQSVAPARRLPVPSALPDGDRSNAAQVAPPLETKAPGRQAACIRVEPAMVAA